MHASRIQTFKMNKSFPQSPTASSETSETQSINDEPLTINRKVSIKNIKKNKEPEKERPPWKPVSIAGPSKADKNALLKAKILDATRRALISQRIAHISTQTDPIPKKDVQVETDGSVTIKKESPGGFILTQTIGLSTDDTLVNDIGTQTARPKTNLSFRPFPFKNMSDNWSIYGSVDDNILKNVRILQSQAQDIKRLEEQLWQKRNKTDNKPDDTTTPMKKDVSDDVKESEFSDDSLCENEKVDKGRSIRTFSNESYDPPSNYDQDNFLDAPTLASWTGFESADDDEYDLPELPKKTISEGCQPWSNFKDLLIGNRLANMHLSPIPPRKASYKRKSVTWSDAQHQAVSELMSEASALLDVFDNVAMLIGPELNLKLTPKTMFEPSKLPASKWQPVLEKCTTNLEDQLKTFDRHTFPETFAVEDISN